LKTYRGTKWRGRAFRVELARPDYLIRLQKIRDEEKVIEESAAALRSGIAAGDQKAVTSAMTIVEWKPRDMRMKDPRKPRTARIVVKPKDSVSECFYWIDCSLARCTTHFGQNRKRIHFHH
jgi:hypothetical protein